MQLFYPQNSSTHVAWNKASMHRSIFIAVLLWEMDTPFKLDRSWHQRGKKNQTTGTTAINKEGQSICN